MAVAKGPLVSCIPMGEKMMLKVSPFSPHPWWGSKLGPIRVPGASDSTGPKQSIRVLSNTRLFCKL